MPHQPFKSRIFGVGGAGVSALQRLHAEGAPAAELVAINTDVQSLSASAAGSKIQIGRRVTRGLGAGGDPEIGLAAAEEALDEIRNAARGCNLVVLLTGLGGGTGSGAAPLIARALAEDGIWVAAIATMPFHFEGRRRAGQAAEALASLRGAAHAVIVFENDRLGEPLSPQAGIREAFANADLAISRAALGLVSIACRESLIQLSLDDVFKALAVRDGRCLFGFGMSDSRERALDALDEALQSPLMDRGLLIEHCRDLVVQVTGGGGLTLLEVQELMENLGRLIGDETQVLFGLGADPSLGDSVSVILLGSVPEADYARRRQTQQSAAPAGRAAIHPGLRAAAHQPPPPAAARGDEEDYDRPAEFSVRHRGEQGAAAALQEETGARAATPVWHSARHAAGRGTAGAEEPHSAPPPVRREPAAAPRFEDNAGRPHAERAFTGDPEETADAPEPRPAARPASGPAGLHGHLSSLVRKLTSPASGRGRPPEPAPATPAPAPPPAAPQTAGEPLLLDVDEEGIARKGASRVVRPRAEAPRPKQELFEFDQPGARGRFEKSDPTIIDGEDLDIPTFMRQNRKP